MQARNAHLEEQLGRATAQVLALKVHKNDCDLSLCLGLSLLISVRTNAPVLNQA